MGGIVTKKKHSKIRGGKDISIKTIVKGVILSCILTIVGLLLLTLLITYTDLIKTDGQSKIIIMIISLISVVLGGLKQRVGKTWMLGGITGALYFVIIAIIGNLITHDMKLTFGSLTMFIICVSGGTLGGVIKNKK